MRLRGDVGRAGLGAVDRAVAARRLVEVEVADVQVLGEGVGVVVDKGEIVWERKVICSVGSGVIKVGSDRPPAELVPNLDNFLNN